MTKAELEFQAVELRRENDRLRERVEQLILKLEQTPAADAAADIEEDLIAMESAILAVVKDTIKKIKTHLLNT